MKYEKLEDCIFFEAVDCEGGLLSKSQPGFQFQIYSCGYFGDFLGRYSSAIKCAGRPHVLIDLKEENENRQTFEIAFGLNPSQRLFFESMTKKLEILHGPPGTGKSHLIANLLPTRKTGICGIQAIIPTK